MLGLLGILNIGAPCYFVADAYYAAGKIVKGLLKQGHHLVTRVKSNAVAYAPAGQKKGRRKRGRSKVYGKKIKLKSLLWNTGSMQEVASPVYGERNVILRYRVCDLLWRPAGLLVRFVAVIHPTRGACLLMCTDTSLCAVEIIRIYGLRFKIELCFKQAMRLIGTFAYHFWMRDMIPLRYRNGNQYLHRKVSSTTESMSKQNPRLSCLHSGWRCRPGAAPVSRGRCSQARLGLVRVLAQNHSSWHPAIGVCRCKRFAPHASRISHEFLRKRFSHEIYRRSARQR